MNKAAVSNHVITAVKQGDKYINWIPTEMIADEGNLSTAWNFIKGGERTRPNGDIPIVPLTGELFPEKVHEGLILQWLGHSSVLLEISEYRILIDPVFSKYASPYPSLLSDSVKHR